MKVKYTTLLGYTLICLVSLVTKIYAYESIDSLRMQFESTKFEQTDVNVDLLVKLSWAYRRSSADSTILYGEKALKMAIKNEYLIGQAGALKNIGIGYSIQGKIDSALHYMEASLRVAEQLEDEFLIGRNLNNLGLTHHRQGNYEVALEYYLQSLIISEKIGDATSGVTLMNIGLLQQKTEDYDQALINFRRALTIAEKESNPNRISSCLYNIGSIYHQREKYDYAQSYYQQALKKAKENEDLLLSTKLLLSIGRVMRAKKNYKEASQYFVKANKTATQINDPETIGQTWSELAFISYQNQNYNDAVNKGLQGLEIAEKIKSKDLQKNLLRVLSDSYAKIDEYKIAFEFNQKFIKVSNELFNLEKVRKINALQVSKKMQEKENEVLILKAQKLENESIIKAQKAKYYISFLAFLLTCLALTFLYSINKSQRDKNKNLQESVAERTKDLELANFELRNSNEELERFAFITSHDLKEPLRNISGFTGLLKRKLKGSLDEESRTYIKYVQKSTQQMHQLIEDVLEYSRIGKQNENLSLVDLNEVFQKAYTSLPDELINKKKEFSLQNLPVLEGVEPHFHLIFKNLIENSLKYNDKETVRIELQVKDHASYWLFSMKDNGIGIDKEFIDQVFVMFKRLHNREEYSGSGLGLALVKKVIERAGGRIWLESTLKLGTTFFFTIPKKLHKKHMNIEMPLEMVN